MNESNFQWTETTKMLFSKESQVASWIDNFCLRLLHVYVFLFDLVSHLTSSLFIRTVRLFNISSLLLYLQIKNHDATAEIELQVVFCYLQIYKDDLFWDTKMKPRLTAFYRTCLLPEIIDPRYPRKLEIRNLPWIS